MLGSALQKAQSCLHMLLHTFFVYYNITSNVNANLGHFFFTPRANTPMLWHVQCATISQNVGCLRNGADRGTCAQLVKITCIKMYLTCCNWNETNEFVFKLKRFHLRNKAIYWSSGAISKFFWLFLTEHQIFSFLKSPCHKIYDLFFLFFIHSFTNLIWGSKFPFLNIYAFRIEFIEQ